ncbi:MAG TPA: hypothetical protein VMW33_04945 [Ilumatobacteraceae bacterium]|nr:hypothetical protein [Ilumatobacteraceae bacterium]
MNDTPETNENIATTETDLATGDRRALLRKIAIGGAGAAAGAVLLSNGRASAAAEPGALELGEGQTNTSTTPTTLVHDPLSARTEGPSSLSVAGAVPAADAPFPAQVGGYGNDEVANGLHGSTDNDEGFGVVAANLATGPAANNTTDPVPTALAIASSGAHVRLLAGAVTGPTPGDHVAGELYVDKDGTLWFTVPAPTTTDATAVRFVKLAGTPTSGSFHAIDPQRAYDSRQAAYTVTGPLAPNTNRVISVADGHDTNGGAVTTSDVVPVGATAVQINVTAANMTAPNFLSVTAGDKTSTNTSLLNWSPGDIQIANSITVPLDADRQIRVYNGNQTGSTDVIIDVFGYYL